MKEITRQQKLQQLAERVNKCTKCSLRETATQPVMGIGALDAKYLIIGEAPGKEEDKLGCPFVGSAGKRLNKLIALAGIDENEIYITNTIRCRPPKNRDPRKGELSACAEWLSEEIRLVEPEYIISLGRMPLGIFSPYKISQMHGTMLKFEWEGREYDVIAQYHPAAALHNPRLWATLLDDWAHLPQRVDASYTVVDWVCLKRWLHE